MCEAAGQQAGTDLKEKSTWTNICSNPALVKEAEAEGYMYAQHYKRDAQWIFNRVQHHVHRKDKNGDYVPLHACERKVRTGSKRTKKDVTCVRHLLGVARC